MDSNYFADILEIYSDSAIVSAGSFQSVISHLGTPDLAWYNLDKGRVESLLTAVSELLVIGSDAVTIEHLREFKEGDGEPLVELVLDEEAAIEPDSEDFILAVMQLKDGTFSYWLVEAMEDNED